MQFVGFLGVIWDYHGLLRIITSPLVQTFPTSAACFTASCSSRKVFRTTSFVASLSALVVTASDGGRSHSGRVDKKWGRIESVQLGAEALGQGEIK